MEKRAVKHKPAKSTKRRFVLYLCVLLMLTFFLTAGRFLALSQSPQQADTIIVLSGGQGRVEKAAELYQAGFASSLILTNGLESKMLSIATSSGIPQDAILLENAALSTYQNAEYTLPIMKEHGYTSAIVVSSDFHMRRVKLLFDRVYKGSGIELTYVSSETSYNASRWWSNHRSRETTFNEYVKMVGNVFGYNGPEAKTVLQEIKSWFR